MKLLRWFLLALLFVSFSAAGDCWFDGDTPEDYGKLKKDMLISLGGKDCAAFELWVGPNDDTFAQYKVRIPRAIGSHAWQQCGYSIGISEFKFREYIWDFIDEDMGNLVRFLGICGYFKANETDPDDPGTFVPIDSAETVLEATLD
jgi:hypothetical protein